MCTFRESKSNRIYEICCHAMDRHCVEKMDDFVNFLKSEYAATRTPIPYHKATGGGSDASEFRKSDPCEYTLLRCHQSPDSTQ